MAAHALLRLAAAVGAACVAPAASQALVATVPVAAALEAWPTLPPVPPAPTLPPAPLYDCHAEYDFWEVAWSPDWKEWCCQHEGLGCPSTTTTTSGTSTSSTTSATATSTTVTTVTSSTTTRTTRTETTSTTSDTTTTRTTTGTQTTTTPAACDVECAFGGVAATCGARINWASAHDVAKEESPCEAARVLVTSQCSDCGSCTVEAAKCEVATTAPAKTAKKGVDIHLRKKFEAMTRLPASRAAAWPGLRPLILLFCLVCVAAAALSQVYRRPWRRLRADERVFLRLAAREEEVEDPGPHE